MTTFSRYLIHRTLFRCVAGTNYTQKMQEKRAASKTMALRMTSQMFVVEDSSFPTNRRISVAMATIAKLLRVMFVARGITVWWLVLATVAVGTFLMIQMEVKHVCVVGSMISKYLYFV